MTRLKMGRLFLVILSFLLLTGLFACGNEIVGSNNEDANVSINGNVNPEPIVDMSEEIPENNGPIGIQYYSELTLSASKMELKVGESATLSVIDGLEESYRFSSTSSAVSVDQNGNITALEIGAASIIVKGKLSKGVCIVIVSDTIPVQLESLEIDSSVTTLKVADVRQMTLAKIPVNADDYNSIRWSSNNEDVAVITRDGIVTAMKAGVATLTVVATGTNISDTITITVEPRHSTLNFVHDDITALVNEAPLTLGTKLFTDHDDTTIEGFTSSNTSVATVDQNGKVTFVSKGKTTITYSVVTGGERLVAECKVAVIEKEGYTVIRTPEQLQAIGNTSGNYMLGNDIDLREACSKGGSLYYAGLGFTPLFNKKALAFSGTFDGMGYSIKNLYINRPETPFVALFGYINVNKGSEGLICNLALDGGKIEGGNHVSAFVAYHNGSGSANAGVKNCWTNIEIVAHGNHSGGFVSYNGGMIENCYSLSKISGTGILSSISHNVAESNEIGVKNTYVASDVNSQASWLVYQNNLRESIMQAEYKSLHSMTAASLYSTWDTNIWLIQDGYLPTLKTENDR